jgi:hypothetical protein
VKQSGKAYWEAAFYRQQHDLQTLMFENAQLWVLLAQAVAALEVQQSEGEHVEQLSMALFHANRRAA